MKILIYFIVNLIAFCFVGASQNLKEIYTSEVRGIIENTINSTLNKIRANLTDPISIASKTFDFGEGEAISGRFNVSSLKINGVRDFVAKDIKVHVLSREINMKILITELTVHFKYWIDTVLLNLVPVYGHGRMSVSFDEIELDVQASADIEDGPKIKDIVLLFSLSEATFELNGLLDNPEYSSLISNALNDNFANFVNHNAQVISDAICPIIETVINSLLEPENVHVKDVRVLVKISG